jgi:hypothetical protein
LTPWLVAAPCSDTPLWWSRVSEVGTVPTGQYTILRGVRLCTFACSCSLSKNKGNFQKKPNKIKSRIFFRANQEHLRAKQACVARGHENAVSQILQGGRVAKLLLGTKGTNSSAPVLPAAVRQ